MRAARIDWKPLWAVLGCALPVSFAQQIEPALYYLQDSELVPLYGTEWLLFATLGVLLTLGVWLAGWLLRSSNRVATTLAARVVLVVAASSFTLGLVTIAHIQGRVLVIVGAAVVLAGLLPQRLLASDYMQQLHVTLRRIGQLGAVAVLGVVIGGISTASPGRPRSPSAANAHEQRPNIVLITIDTLSAEHMSVYGASLPTSSQLERFARESIVFTRAYANGNFTTAGVSSILTGTRPWTHRALQAPGTPRAAVASDALPGHLRAAGYVTAAISTNPWASPRRLGVGSQFDVLFPDQVAAVSGCSETILELLSYTCAALQNSWLASLNAAFDTWRFRLFFQDNREYDPTLAIVQATRWLRQSSGRPVFLWVHLIPPHDPYAAPKPWLQSQWQSSP